MTSQGMASEYETPQPPAETHDDTQLATRLPDIHQGPCASSPETPHHPIGLREPAAAREASTQVESLPAPTPAPGASSRTPQPALGQSLPPLSNVVGAISLATSQLPSPPLGPTTLPQPLESDGEGPPPRVGFVDSTIKSLDEKLRNLLYQEHVPTSSTSAGTPVEMGDRDFILEPPRGDRLYTEASRGDPALPSQFVVSTGFSQRCHPVSGVWTEVGAKSSLVMQSCLTPAHLSCFPSPISEPDLLVCFATSGLFGNMGCAGTGSGTGWHLVVCVERLEWGAHPGMGGDDLQFSCRDVSN